MTAIATIAAKYGASQLIRALTGNDELSGLASELLGELVASEDRLSEQLAGIGRQLEELLDQRYTIALGAGQRALRDASTAPDPNSRAAELARARDLFREASVIPDSRRSWRKAGNGTEVSFSTERLLPGQHRMA